MDRLITPRAYEATAQSLYLDISTRILNRITDWDFATSRETIKKLWSFLHASIGELGDRSFCLELCQDDDTGKSSVTADFILAENSSEPRIIRLGPNLGVLEVKLIIPSPIEIDEEFASSHSTGCVIAFYEQRSLVRFYAGGYTAGRLDPRFEGALTAKQSRFGRRPEQYKQAVVDHYLEQVRDWNGTDHWEDRSKRLLRGRLGSAKKTEDIFQNSLINWLEINLAADVKGKVGQVSSDATDIEISALGSIYIIEIKWLGEGGKTTYGLERISKGLRQVHDYLKKQSMAKGAILVAYDARPESEFLSLDNIVEKPDEGCVLVSHCDGENVCAKAECMVLFLRSTTASQS